MWLENKVMSTKNTVRIIIFLIVNLRGWLEHLGKISLLQNNLKVIGRKMCAGYFGNMI